MKHCVRCRSCGKISSYNIGSQKYEQALSQIEGIANAVVSGYHFSDNYKDLSEHFQELNKEILRIINDVTQ